MKRWLFNLVSAASLLLSLTAAVAWARSYARTGDWHLLGIAHSADLARVDLNRRNAVTMVPVQRSDLSRYGFWDAWWVHSQSGRLTLVAHYLDYEDGLRGVHASPPSVIVELTGRERAKLVAFDRLPDSLPWVRRLGFAWDADAQHAAHCPVSVKAQMITLPYWFLVLLGLTVPLLWMRVHRRAAT